MEGDGVERDRRMANYGAWRLSVLQMFLPMKSLPLGQAEFPLGRSDSSISALSQPLRKPHFRIYGISRIFRALITSAFVYVLGFTNGAGGLNETGGGEDLGECEI